MTVLGLDIGGANLKAADAHGRCASAPFPLWKQPERLSAALVSLIRRFPHAAQLAVTTTGELADCFATKREGVEHILAATEVAAKACGDLQVDVYLADGRLIPLDEIQRNTAGDRLLLAAASNWHALARFAGRLVAGAPSALLIDIGTTTADIIPLVDGRPAAQGNADTTRLLAGELCYSGVERTPVCAVAANLPYRGKHCPTAAELFATTLDAYLMLDEIAEDPAHTHTADGRPATKANARDRLARAICADRETFDARDAQIAATAIAAAQCEQVAAAARLVVANMSGPPRAIIVSGSGEFLARRVAAAIAPHVPVISLAAAPTLSPAAQLALSRCATAYALAVLASETRPSPRPRTSGGASPAVPDVVCRRVIKLGGSVLADSHWPEKFRRWLASQPPACNLLVVGGGELANAIRAADATHRLGDRASHWLAIRAMTIQAEIAATLLPEHAGMIREPAQLLRLAELGLWIAEPYALLQADERAADGGTLPHTWDVTSDSIAARLARLMGAGEASSAGKSAAELVLIKAAPPGTAPGAAHTLDAKALSAAGFVDVHFPLAAAGLCWRIATLAD